MEQPWTFLSCPFAQLCFSLDKHLPQELIIDTGQAQIIRITALPLSSEIYCLRQATLRMAAVDPWFQPFLWDGGREHGWAGSQLCAVRSSEPTPGSGQFVGVCPPLPLYTSSLSF